jgi:hypothetical protein
VAVRGAESIFAPAGGGVAGEEGDIFCEGGCVSCDGNGIVFF